VLPWEDSLNVHANACARILLKSANLRRSTHKVAIDDLAISEAFPSSFLGLMIKDPASLKARRGNRSDTFFKYLAENGVLHCLLEHFLAGRKTDSPFEAVENHDDRAALVCALTALSVAGGDFVAVGDGEGWNPSSNIFHSSVGVGKTATEQLRRARGILARGASEKWLRSATKRRHYSKKPSNANLITSPPRK